MQMHEYASITPTQQRILPGLRHLARKEARTLPRRVWRQDKENRLWQGVQRSGKSQGNSRLWKSQGILLKVKEKMNIGKSQGIRI